MEEGDAAGEKTLLRRVGPPGGIRREENYSGEETGHPSIEGVNRHRDRAGDLLVDGNVDQEFLP